MKLVCVRDFGNFKTGDECEVDDNAIYDKTYFTEAKAKPKGGDK